MHYLIDYAEFARPQGARDRKPRKRRSRQSRELTNTLIGGGTGGLVSLGVGQVVGRRLGLGQGQRFLLGLGAGLPVSATLGATLAKRDVSKNPQDYGTAYQRRQWKETKKKKPEYAKKYPQMEQLLLAKGKAEDQYKRKMRS